MQPARLTLVLGGARSGKSRHAESLLAGAGPCLYVATATAFDDEMRARIELHRRRRGAQWRTLEAPLALADAVAANDGSPMLIDCLTVWLGNLLHAGEDLDGHADAFIDALRSATGPVVLVANEVGLGIVPDNALARRFRDAAGSLNQRVAAEAGHVVLVTAGLPLSLKGPG